MKKHKHGGDIYSGEIRVDFSANINPLGPPKSVQNAMCACASRIQNYPDTECRRLRRALAQKEGVSEEYLIFGNGAAELIFSLAQGIKPKKALLTTPSFAEYEEALTAAGCSCTYYNRRNGFQVEADYLDEIGEELDIAFLCNPNNPTGNLMERDFLKKVLDQCREKKVLLAVDECFLGFLEKPECYEMKGYLEEYPNLFVLRAFTKLYAMPGLRLGYGMCSDKQLLEQIQRVMQPWSVSLPAQAAGEAALTEDAYVETARRLVKTERAYLERELKQLGFTVFPGSVNYVFFQGPGNLAGECKKQGFLIRDCGNYRGLSEGYYRIAVRTRKENDALLAVLGTIMGTREDS